MAEPVLLWLRRDLRLHDQAALIAAAAEGPVIPVYILDDETARHRRMGGASRWWLHHSLASLAQSLEERGSRLILKRGGSDAVLATLAEETGATRVHAIRHHEPWWVNAERAAAKRLTLVLHDGNYLTPAGSVLNGSGDPYKVYTPFARTVMERMPPPVPQPPPELSAPQSWPDSDDLDDWMLLPTKPDWATGFAGWQPGEAGAAARIASFAEVAAVYERRRNLPAVEGTSRLSPHLHFGEVSPAAVWHATAGAGGSVEKFLKELIWRDYATSLIVQFPGYGSENGRGGYDRFPWRDDAAADADFTAWTKGRTGYPIVDAGMRQLWATGWMHNRVRMIAASFLVKHLLIDWRRGEQWFWDTLVDADYASNASNWQWVAGTGVDAPMFSRIMAPLPQSEKFDAAGYIRQWVPEIADLDEPYIHDPEDHGVRPSGYPPKLIGHRAARERALAAMRHTRDGV